MSSPDNKPAAERPIIVYVDDESRNLSLFEMSVPDHWQVVTFESGIEALKAIKKHAPAVIVSDQRMPNMTGLEFLEIAAELVPDAVRFVVTGQTDEATIVELVRRAKIFDYVTKPWNTDDLISRLGKAIAYNHAVRERERLIVEVNRKNQELTAKNHELLQLSQELAARTQRESQLREELEGLTHWQVAERLKAGAISFPFRRDLACITFDIVGSSSLADTYVKDRPVRSHVILMFKELILQHGGLVESQGGDACYAHFGAFDTLEHPCTSAFHAAREFRVKLRNFSSQHGINVEAGVALHFAEDVVVDQDIIKIILPNGPTRAKKDIHTQSRDVDSLHRMEKLAHRLPGTNIIVSRQFADRLKQVEVNLISLCSTRLSGQESDIELLVLKSDLVSDAQLREFIAGLSQRHELEVA